MNHIAELKNQSQDFEFYPTTNEILECLSQNIEIDKYGRNSFSFLDIGAGNGKVLDFFKEKRGFGPFYAIEKSQINLSNLNSEYYILGVDFHKTTLIDKKADIIFCNPPYSEYVEWVCKIIKESDNNSVIYLVIPQRWKNNDDIQNFIKQRKATVEVLGDFDFQNSEDREARAKVNLLKIEFTRESDEAFDSFFDENFKYPEPPEKEFEFIEEKEQKELVGGQNLIERLCQMHDNRVQILRQNYNAVCGLSYDLLKEFEISKRSLISSLKMKIAACRKHYWQELFNNLKTINKTLTHSSRQKIVDIMNQHTGIEFNVENCYAVVLWVIKNANKYYDSQLIETYNQFLDYANIENYVSNQRVFKQEKYYYDKFYQNYVHGNADYEKFRLKIGQRIVSSYCGGINKTVWQHDKGLSERGQQFIEDLLVIARNLGFIPSEDQDIPEYKHWESGKTLFYTCQYKGEKVVLFKIRAFYNSNIHFSFLPEFIHALNIQHGKLKGWISSYEEAQKECLTEEEKKETPELLSLTEAFFNSNFKIGKEQLLLGV